MEENSYESLHQRDGKGKQVEDEASNNISTSESFYSFGADSPGGSKLVYPNIPVDEKPIVGSEFATLDDGINMYKAYAKKSGFNVKLSTNKHNKYNIVVKKYVMCNRAYKPVPSKSKSDEVSSGKKPRKVNTQKTDCKAKIVFGMSTVSNIWVVRSFEEGHNHDLIPPSYSHLLCENRKLGFHEQDVVKKLASSRIGATKAHQILSTLRGSQQFVRGTIVDFKNYQRDLNLSLGENDAQMLVDSMEERVKHSNDFTFKYHVNDTGELARFFWADQVAKLNYQEFGDIISFDDTNKYDMAFVPFTGIDNHRNCVTFGAGMLSKEDIPSYTWLLQSFVETFKVQPNIVVSDQDPAMKQAVEVVFTESKHRLCMWHITTKLPSKVSSKILEGTNFRSDFHKLVWNIYLGPIHFERKWLQLMKDYPIKETRWFDDLFRIRDKWIPAYFKTTDMCGLMRTSSLSESENSFFSKFQHRGHPLIQFMCSFDSAMQKQRYNQEILDHQTMNTNPKFKTPLNIERHAAKVYTRRIFFLVQHEIFESVFSCSHQSVENDEGVLIYKVKENCIETPDVKKDVEKIQLYTTERLKEFTVLFNKVEVDVVCTCEHFPRIGVLCRHAFYVLKLNDIQEIPDKFIKRRWTRDLIPADIRQKKYNYSETNVVVEGLANEAITMVDSCVRTLINNEDELKKFVEAIRDLKSGVEKKMVDEEPTDKGSRLRKRLGVKLPKFKNVINPQRATRKGRGKRIKGVVEKAKETLRKTEIKCGKCGKKTKDHDRRTCKELVDVNGELIDQENDEFEDVELEDDEFEDDEFEEEEDDELEDDMEEDDADEDEDDQDY